jgi:hypothetical protein
VVSIVNLTHVTDSSSCGISIIALPEFKCCNASLWAVDFNGGRDLHLFSMLTYSKFYCISLIKKILSSNMCCSVISVDLGYEKEMGASAEKEN